MANKISEEIWADDLLGFQARGNAFTTLVQSIDDHRTISIEAGYGHGKTFFRERWAKQLEATGECVVQIDARLSDHSGDPVVTFLAALLSLVPEKDTASFEKAADFTKKIAVGGAKVAFKAVLREGAKEAFEAFEPEDGDVGTLHSIAEAAGESLSKAAGEMIAAQFSAEKARVEVAAQLSALRDQITKDTGQDRIIILVDELDRCHPEYAIAFMEAMKLVFDQDGFVFVLMVNRDYMEGIARHRFGAGEEGEAYLDKFIDLRLKLLPEEDARSAAAKTLAMGLPYLNPYSDDPEFSLERAAKLAGELVVHGNFSMRETKRALDRVELALRLYSSLSVDGPLLVWFAFEALADSSGRKMNPNFLPRTAPTKESGEKRLSKRPNVDRSRQEVQNWAGKLNNELATEFSYLLELENSVLGVPDDGRDYYPYARIFQFFTPHYIASHKAMIDAVRTLQADP